VIILIIENFDVQVQIILLLHHYCQLLMMIMRFKLVVNHLKCNKKEKRKLTVVLRSACKTVHILLWTSLMKYTLRIFTTLRILFMLEVNCLLLFFYLTVAILAVNFMSVDMYGHVNGGHCKIQCWLFLYCNVWVNYECYW